MPINRVEVSKLTKILDRSFWRYQWHGLTHRWGCKVCPACGSDAGSIVDWKGVHVLCNCEQCSLLYRHPRESEESMSAFYQSEYSEKGMTADLPTEKELENLMDTRFKGTDKDFSYQISILNSLGIRPGMKVLDFGANWGYLSFQLKSAGYQVESFEISKPRAEFGSYLGLQIKTDLSELTGQYDCVYSSHVLEHVPNPAATLKQQFAMVKPGGLVVAHTPNGSEAWRRKATSSFRNVWGLVHPVLLTDRFVKNQFLNVPFLVTSCDKPENVAAWNQTEQKVEECNEWGLFFAIRKPSEEARFN